MSPLHAAISPIPVKSLNMLPTPELVKSYIAAGLDCQHLEVEGDGQHFTAVIYAALGDRMREEIHALSMKTLTPEEFQK